MKKPRVLVRDQIRLTAKVLDIPAPFVRQVMSRMKTDGRLPSTRPVTSDVTAESLARLVLGLCAPLPGKSTDTEIAIGAVPRIAGDGADTVASELESLINEAAGVVDGEIDFWSGDLLVGVDRPSLVVHVVRFDGTSTLRLYRGKHEREEGVTRFVRIPLQTLRMLALELMGD